MEIQKYIDYTIHLIKCSISGDIPKDLPDGMSLDVLFKFCRYHKVENTVYYALKQLGLSEDEMLEFHRAHLLASIVDANQDVALNEIANLFNENKIDYLPLKGSVIKHIYPSTDMRQSADIDIYIGEENALKAKEIMLSIGYITDESLFGVDVDDSYQRGVYVNVELHRSLLPDVYQWKKECRRIEKRFRNDSRENFEYKMTKEDFYVYMVIHTAKHMRLSGCGIRSVLDIWIYLKEYAEVMDMDKINLALKKCELTKFEKNIRTLAYLWFEGFENYEELITELGYHIAVGGWIGRAEYRNAKFIAQNYSAKNKKISKLKYYFSLIFLKRDRMMKKYPILEKYKFLILFFWIKRGVESIRGGNYNLKDANDKAKKIQDEMQLGKKMLDFDKKIGL